MKTVKNILLISAMLSFLLSLGCSPTLLSGQYRTGPDPGDGDYIVWDFRSDGTMRRYGYLVLPIFGRSSFTESGTYSIKGNEVTVLIEDPKIRKILKIEKNGDLIAEPFNGKPGNRYALDTK